MGRLDRPDGLCLNGSECRPSVFNHLLYFRSHEFRRLYHQKRPGALGHVLFYGLHRLYRLDAVECLFLQRLWLGASDLLRVVLLFAGVTAYEVQQIKRSYIQQENELAREAKAIFGAFILFGSFVTIFVHVLSILGFLGRGE